MARRYDHPKRQRGKAAIAERQMRERLAGDVSPIMDVAFVKLHEELVQWPDGWHLDPHGTGNNPHVWFRTGTEFGVCTCGALESDVYAGARQSASSMPFTTIV